VSRPLQLTSWNAELATRFPAFPAPVIAVLALYSFGMILAKVSGLSAVVLFLAQRLGLAEPPLRKRLREFYLDAAAKSGVKQGQKRRDFDVTLAFAPLLRWILSLWSGQHLPLAVDVTNLGARFHVLCVSVVVRGTALPVAWKVLYGGQKEPWGPHWQALLTHLRAAVPATWAVLVLSDRGLESPALFRDIVALGWHPLMRVKKAGKFRPTGWGQAYTFAQLAPRPGTSLQVAGRAFAGEKLSCTLLARSEAGYAEPWFLLTDLPPEAAEAVWYGLRTWIEQGFKVIKGGGWAWDKTRMEDAERVERLWLVLAVATLWVVAVGAEEEVRAERQAELRKLTQGLNEAAEQEQARQERERQRRQRQAEAQQRRRERQAKRRAAKRGQTAKKKPAGARHANAGATARKRAHRVSRRGLAVLKGAWARGETRLPMSLHPEPWPLNDHAVTTLNEQDFLQHQT
jgi:hypothetical protein